MDIIVIAYIMKRLSAEITAREDHNNKMMMIHNNNSMKKIQGRITTVMVIVYDLKVAAILTITNLVHSKRSTR